MRSYTLFRVWLVGGLLALLTACGGGGDGASASAPTPTPTPTPTDVTAPTVVSVIPTSGATIPVGQVFTLTFSEAIACPQAVTEGSFGAITGSAACISSNTAGKGVITVVPAAPLYFDTQYTLTLSGFKDLAGNVGVPYASSFTTEKLPGVSGRKIFVANDLGNTSGANGSVTLIDGVTQTITERVTFPSAPGYFGSTYLDIDAGTGTVYSASRATFVLHRFELATGKVLPSLVLDPTEQPGYIHGIYGLAHSDKAVCVTLGRPGFPNASYYWHNKMECFDRATGKRVFLSAVDFVAGSGQAPVKLLYSAKRGTFYAVAADESSLLASQVLDGYKVRPGFGPGTSGRVTEIDATTYQVTRTWTIGSAPNDAAFRGDKLYVVNAGDKSLSIIDLAATDTTKAVATVTWGAAYGPYENPLGIAIDEASGVYYLSDYLTSVRKYSLTDNREIGRIVLGSETEAVTIIGGKLWVTSLLDYPADTLLNTVYVVDLGTDTVERTFPAIGDKPRSIIFYDPAP